MTRRLPSINALRSFEAAARHLSFKRAAKELSVSPAAIGYQVKRLEEDFGGQLFIRQHRSIRLTPEGAALMRRLGQAFKTIETAWTDSRPPEVQSTLCVTAPIAVVQKWLLHEPDLRPGANTRHGVTWDMSQTFRSLARGGMDAAIRYSAIRDPDHFSEPLLRQCYTPLMRPDVARNIKTPADLLKHGLIDLSFDLAAEPDLDVWKVWFNAQGLHPPDRYEIACGYTMAAADMAQETGHVAMGGYFVVADDLAAGRLVAPFSLGVVPQSQLWFLCEKGREDEPGMLWFRQTIRDAAARVEATAAHFKLVDLAGNEIRR